MLFQVIVPNEKDASTVEVTLQVPKDVLPFSFEEPDGWTRENKEGADGSMETITWKGELAEDGFARFSFLASTPGAGGRDRLEVDPDLRRRVHVALDRRRRTPTTRPR